MLRVNTSAVPRPPSPSAPTISAATYHSQGDVEDVAAECTYKSAVITTSLLSKISLLQAKTGGGA